MKWSKGTIICIFLWAIFIFKIQGLPAQSAREVAVEIQARKSTNGFTELFWKSDTGVLRYYISKRVHPDSNWNFLDSLGPSILNFIDTNSIIGKSVEYRVSKKKNNYSFLGNGYIRAGFDVAGMPTQGIILCLIDSNYHIPLKDELTQYFGQLEAEGYVIRKRIVLRTDSVLVIKSWIFSQWIKDSSLIRCAVLLGHIPVPYSGDLSPDGHADHRGAWPADNYYGSFHTTWTDNIVNRSTASRIANRNVPGDGKFDVSRINPVGTSLINTLKFQLPIARIDFFDMPAFGSDTMLMRRYLAKNLLFRRREVQFDAKGLIDDNFGYFSGEAFASGGFRNFSTYFGDSIIEGDYTGYGSGMKSSRYLWSYGCGGGTYTSCTGVSSSVSMALDSLLNPFTMLFGSYFGDWDNQNNFLRAPLASRGWGLVSVWSGRPYWLMHESALGAPLYTSVISTYNCTNLYAVGAFGSGHVHVAMIGDPTLKVFPVANVRGLKSKSQCDGRVFLQWEKTIDQPDSILVEYWKNGRWILFATIPGSDTQFIHAFDGGKYKFSLREKKLMHSASGSWWDVGARELVDLNVNLQDTIRVTASAKSLCEGDTFIIYSDCRQKSNIKGWKLNQVSLGKVDSVIQVFSKGQGTIWVSVFSQTDSGCISMDSVNIRAIATDTISIVNLTDSSIAVKSKLRLPIQWFINDTLIASETDTLIRIKKTGIYKAKTNNEGFCESVSDTVHVIHKPTLTTTSTPRNSQLRIYPNPTSGIFFISHQPSSRDCYWKVVDSRGVECARGRGQLGDLSELSAGLYYLFVDDLNPRILFKQ